MQLHASCVAIAGKGLLIRGASASGKSALALQLMAMGAILVADDRTDVCLVDGWPIARAPATIRGLIEARGIGILAAETVSWVRLGMVVDLDEVEPERVPPDRWTDVLGHRLPLCHKIESDHFAAALRQYMIGGKALR